MFGKKKKESKIEEQPMPIEPVEDFLDAEIIEDDEIAPAELDTDSIVGEEINFDEIDDLSGAIGDQRSSVDDIMITQGIENIPNDVFLETADLEIEPAEEAVAEPVQEEELLPDFEEATTAEEVEEPVEEEVAEEPIEEEEAIEEDEVAEEDEEAEEDATEEVEEPVEEPAEESEEVVYVVDGPEEDDEIVHASKLVKLPHLIDYIVNSDPKPSKKALMKYAMMLAELYKKCKNADDKKIVKDCVMKVANALR